MYTLEMATAFKSVKPPENFGVILYDSENFLTMLIDAKDLEGMSKEEAELAVKYINDVKKALETAGAIVYITRRNLDE